MHVAEAKTRIVIDSGNAQLALDKLVKSMGAYNSALRGAGNTRNIEAGIKSVNANVATLSKTIVQAELGLKALSKFGDMFKSILGGAFEYSTTLESNAVGISGILMSLTKLDGKQLQWNRSLAMSKSIMEDLRNTALQTSATAPELIDTFRAILGPALGSGMDIKQTMQFTTVGVNAVKSMGLEGHQLVQELRAILQGNIRSSSATLATALGITNEDVKNAKNSSEGLYKFLMERLKGFEMSVGETAKTIKGRMAILQEGVYQALDKGAKPAVEALRDNLKTVSDYVLRFNAQTKTMELNPAFVEQVSRLGQDIKAFIELAGGGLKVVLSNLDRFTTTFEMIVGFKLLIGTLGTASGLVGSMGEKLKAANGVVTEIAERFVLLNKEQRNALASAEEDVRSRKQGLKNLAEIADIKKRAEQYDRQILQNVKDQYKAEKDRIAALERQQKLYNSIVKLAKDLSMSKADVDNLLSRATGAGAGRDNALRLVKELITSMKSAGNQAGKVYTEAFDRAIRQYSMGLEAKAVLTKNGVGVTASDASIFAGEVQSIMRRSGAEQQEIERVERLKKLYVELSEIEKKRGVSYESIKTKILAGIEQQVDGVERLTKAELDAVEAEANAAKVKEQIALKAEKQKKAIYGLVGALTSVAMAYQIATNDSESNIGVMADWVIKAGFVVGAISQMSEALKKLGEVIDITTKKEALLKAIQANIVPGAKLLAIAGIAAVAYSAVDKYQAYKEKDYKAFAIDNEDVLRTEAANSYNDEETMPVITDEADNYAYAEDYLKLKGNDSSNGGGGGASTFGGSAERAAERLRKKLKEQANSVLQYRTLMNTVGIANNKMVGSYTDYEQAVDSAKKKTDEWQRRLVNLVAQSGGELDEAGNIKTYGKITEEDYNNAIKAFERYKRLAEEEAARERDIKGYESTLKTYDNLQALGKMNAQRANELRQQTLTEEIAYYENLVQYHNLSYDKMVEYETIIAEKHKALLEAQSTDFTTMWGGVLDHINNISFNLTETFNGGIDTMIGRFTDFGQNIIGETKSVTEQLKELCKNLASDILNMMMKIYMQGLMMNLIGNIFGGGVTKSPYFGGYFDAGNNFSSTSSLNWVRPFAKGGLASGWSIVGERGPELVNFSSPGRVYTAEQTRNALSNGGVNIKIDLRNESGQQMEAQTTGSTFDGESYVVGVVLKAISNNKNGMRSLIKGVAMA